MVGHLLLLLPCDTKMMSEYTKMNIPVTMKTWVLDEYYLHLHLHQDQDVVKIYSDCDVDHYYFHQPHYHQHLQRNF